MDNQQNVLDRDILNINVASVNDEPSFTVVTGITVLNTESQITTNVVVSFDDGDPEVTQSLSYDIIFGDNRAAVGVHSPTLNGSMLTFTPTYDVTGTWSITLRAYDQETSGAPLTFTERLLEIEIQSGPQPIPVFSSSVLNFSGVEDTNIDVVTLVSNAKGDLFYSIENQSLIGQVVITTTTRINEQDRLDLQFIVNSDLNGIATATLVVRDNQQLFLASVPLSFNIQPVNDTPSFTTIANLSVINSSASFSNTVVSNVDDGDAEITQGLSYSVVASNAPAVGANNLAISNAGVLTFEPSVETIGVLTVTIQLTDDGSAGGAALSSTQVVTVQILGGNTAPTFNSALLSDNTNEDTVLNMAIGATDSEGNFAGFSVVTSPTNGVASVSAVTNGENATLTLTYTPNSNFNGTDTIRVSLTDTVGLTDFIDVAINIIAQNDTPSFTAVANLSILNNSAGFSGTIVASSDDGDPEVIQNLSYSVIASNALAVSVNNLVVTSTGILSFVPTIEAAGVLSVTVQVIDDGTAGGAVLASTQVVSVQILDTNTAPSFNTTSLSVNTNEDTALTVVLPATDAEGNFAGFSIDNAPSNGAASITDVTNGSNATLTLTYTPNNNF